jgi:hypothetical protein
MPALPRLAAALLLALILPLAAAHAEGLALRRVMLSAGGVGYFEYAAEVSGNATLTLNVPLAQVDDVLASLIVFDTEGRVAGVSLPGEDGSTAAFAEVPFGPPALSSALAYLNALQGVELTVQGPRPMTGRLLRAEVEPMGEKRPPRTRVSLLTEQGLQQFVLEEAESVQVADSALRGAIEAALAALRGQAARAERPLTLHTEGSGARTLRLAYVAAAPLWKTTYRLLLPEAPGAEARLQAWAVLENASGADWDGVELALQYGNPATFRQALYRTYFVARPSVPVEVLGRILPGVDSGGHPVPAAAPAVQAAPATMALRKAEPAAAPAAQAASTEAAESTVFRLRDPVKLGAGQSATLPILDRNVPAERIWLVQEGRPHPLAAVRLVNATGASLPAGVLTLYDLAAEAAFAGNARLGGVPVGGSRLLAFAEDLRTGVDWRTSEATTIASLTAASGVLHIERRERTTLTITLTAPPTESRTLLLEIPRSEDATLLAEGGLKPSEATGSVWRVPVELSAGASESVVLHVDRMRTEETALAEDSPLLAAILNEQGLTEKARAALQHIASLRGALAAREADATRLTAQRAALEQDEERLRKNIAAVPASDALHGSLIRALAADEMQLSALASEIATADAALAEARAALQQAVQTLRI